MLPEIVNKHPSAFGLLAAITVWAIIALAMNKTTTIHIASDSSVKASQVDIENLNLNISTHPYCFYDGLVYKDDEGNTITYKAVRVGNDKVFAVYNGNNLVSSGDAIDVSAENKIVTITFLPTTGGSYKLLLNYNNNTCQKITQDGSYSIAYPIIKNPVCVI